MSVLLLVSVVLPFVALLLPIRDMVLLNGELGLLVWRHIRSAKASAIDISAALAASKAIGVRHAISVSGGLLETKFFSLVHI